MKKLLLLILVAQAGIATAQVTAQIPVPQNKCDINNPGDMIEVFNLRDSESEIITGQTNVVVTYHETSGDALGNGGVISNPEAYEDLPPEQLIFIRVENVSNADDWQVTTMEIFVRQPPVPLTTDPEPLIEVDIMGDGVAIFDLTEIESQLYADSFAQEITYYITQQDAEAQANAIPDPENFMNTVSPQELFAHARNAPENECTVITSFQIIADENLSLAQIKDVSFTVYPNPTNDFISLSGDTTFKTVVIFSVTGQRIKSVGYAPSNEKAIDVGNLKSGLYFLEVDGKTVQKFIKK